MFHPGYGPPIFLSNIPVFLKECRVFLSQMQCVDNYSNQRVELSYCYQATPNEKPRPDLNSKIFPLQFRMLFYFCSFDFLDGGPVSSAGSTLPLSLLCHRCLFGSGIGISSI